MKSTYLFDYVNENEFKKLERAIKKYNMLAYKKLYFEYYPALKEGNFLGKLISTNKKNNTKTYELKLPTDALFSKVQSDFEASEDTMQVFTNIDTFIGEFKDKSFKSPANNPLSNDVQDSNAKNLNELAMALEELLERINVKRNS